MFYVIIIVYGIFYIYVLIIFSVSLHLEQLFKKNYHDQNCHKTAINSGSIYNKNIIRQSVLLIEQTQADVKIIQKFCHLKDIIKNVNF